MWVLSVIGFAVINLTIARSVVNGNAGGNNGGEITINGGGNGNGGVSGGGQQGGSVTLSNNFNINQRNQLINELENRSPRVTVQKSNDGEDVITLPTEVLYKFLTDQGLQLPPISQIPGFTSDKPHTHKLVTIYPNQLLIVLSNKKKFSNASPAVLSTVLRTPNAGHAVIPGTSGLTLTITLSPQEQKRTIKALGNSDGVNVNINKGTVKLTLNTLLAFLRQQGLKVPSLSDLGLSRKQGKITLKISLDTILSILSNKSKANSKDLSAILKLLIKNNGSLGVKGGVEIRGNGKLGGNCNNGLVQKATSITGGVLNGGLSGAKNIVQGVANQVPIVGGTVSKLEGIKSRALMDLVNGAKKTLDDAGCGIGNIANKLAAGIAGGDVLGGVQGGVNELGTGAGKVLNDATGGVGNIINNAANGLNGKGGMENGGGAGLGGALDGLTGGLTGGTGGLGGTLGGLTGGLTGGTGGKGGLGGTLGGLTGGTGGKGGLGGALGDLTGGLTGGTGGKGGLGGALGGLTGGLTGGIGL